MPIFEYQCRACGHRFEQLVRSQAAATAVACEQCGGTVEKLFSTFGVGGSSMTSDTQAPPSCGRCGENRPPCSPD